MDQEQEKRISQLEEKWLLGTITQEEKQEYARWYNLADDAVLDIPASFAPDRETLRARMLEKINANRSPAVAPVHRIHFVRRRRWWAAAAVLILVCSATWILYDKSKKTESLTAQTTAHDVAPGKTGAVLILSDGRKIILDSTATGLVSKEGDATNTNGELAYNDQDAAPVYHTLNTDRGYQYKIVLPDGSKVWLNAASSIRYPTAFKGATRNVEITGEAYFEVVHNAKQPFIVTTPDGQVEDIGTAFNINAYPDENGVRTTLVEGAIKIKNVVLKPGQQYENGKVSAADLESATAWKDGRFYFNGAELQELMRQVARWYDVEVVYDGPVPAGHFVGSPSRTLTAAQMLTLMKSGGINFRIEDKKIIIMQ